MWEPESHVRDSRFERLDISPLDEFGRPETPAFQARRCIVGRGRGTRISTCEESAKREPAEECFGADVHCGHAHRAIYRKELNVIGSHDPPSVDIDQLFIKHVASEQDLSISALERIEVDAGRFQPPPFESKHGHLRPGYEDLAVLDVDHESRNGRIDLERHLTDRKSTRLNSSH